MLKTIKQYYSVYNIKHKHMFNISSFLALYVFSNVHSKPVRHHQNKKVGRHPQVIIVKNNELYENVMPVILIIIFHPKQELSLSVLSSVVQLFLFTTLLVLAISRSCGNIKILYIWCEVLLWNMMKCDVIGRKKQLTNMPTLKYLHKSHLHKSHLHSKSDCYKISNLTFLPPIICQTIWVFFLIFTSRHRDL